MSVPYRRPGPQGALGESARSISDLSKGERLLPEGTVGSDQPHPPATAGQAVWESLDYTAVDSGLQQRVLREQDPKLKHGKKAEIEVYRWLLTIAAGAVTGLVATGINLGVKILGHLKYNWTFDAIRNHMDQLEKNDTSMSGASDPYHPPFWYPFFTFVSISVLYISVATVLVSCVEPVARGSGIPEIKCYLNGVNIPRVVRFKTLVCKAFGVLFSVAGGLPVGKEGPMIHSGAVVGAGVSQGKCSTLNIDTFDSRFTKFSAVRAFRSDHEKRDFVACGAAAGVAAAFGAPIGGVLFCLEEGATHWSDMLTWRAFVAAMTSAFTLNTMLSLLDGSHEGMLNQKSMITFGGFRTQDSPYQAQEIPLFMVLGCIGGLVGAAFNQLNKIITIQRKKYITKHRFRNMIEATLVAGTVAAISFVIAYYNRDSCQKMARFTEPGEKGGIQLEGFTSFYCPPGMVNDYALLFFQPSEDTIKMLFHSEQDLSLLSLTSFIILYFFLACITYGIAVPSGLFVPSLLLGAGIGRLYGELIGHALDYFEHPFARSEPGVYALIGAAGMLGGMARMLISITVIMIEATRDYSYGIPLMLSLVCAKWVGDLFNEGLYDIHIALNKVPLLHAAALAGPWEQDRAQDLLTAQDVMSPTTDTTCTESEAVADLLALLKRTPHNAYPVAEGSKTSGAFAGIIQRRQLCMLLKAGVYSKPGGEPAEPITWADLHDPYPHFPSVEDAEVAVEMAGGAERATVNLKEFHVATPYTVQATATLRDVLHLFQRMGLRHLPVVNKNNRVVGMITRKDIVHEALHEVEHRLHGDHHGHGAPAGRAWWRGRSMDDAARASVHAFDAVTPRDRPFRDTATARTEGDLSSLTSLL